MSNHWLFNDPPDVAAFTTLQVLEGHPVLMVTHDDDDGAWQFLCGTTDNADDLRMVSLKSMLDGEANLSELFDLPSGGWLGVRHLKHLGNVKSTKTTSRERIPGVR